MAGLDQLSAHLERGWERFEGGDLIGAERSARSALELAPKNPEVLFLLGSVLASDNRPEEAMECFQEAMAEEDGYIDPILAAADLALRAFSDPDECIKLCDEVLDFAEDPEDIADAALLKIDALLELGAEEKAKALLREIPSSLQNPTTLYRLGRACYELKRVKEAEAHLRAAIQIEPKLADAHYDLGHLLGELGREEEARMSFFVAHQLDLEAPRPKDHLSAPMLLMLAERVRAEFPAPLREKLAGAPIVITARIGAELVFEGFDPRALCFFGGQPADPPQGQSATLERIFLYRDPLLAITRTPEEAAREIRAALLAEAAQFFGFSDSDLASWGIF